MAGKTPMAVTEVGIPPVLDAQGDDPAVDQQPRRCCSGRRFVLSSAKLTDCAFTINMELRLLIAGRPLLEQVERQTGRLNVEPHITSEIVLCGGVDSVIDDWPDGTEFGMIGKKLQVGPKHLLVVTACPPGRFGKEVAAGFPKTSQVSPKAGQVETD